MSFDLEAVGGAGLCTLAEVKERIGKETTKRDSLIEALIPLVPVVFSRRYSREFLRSAALERTFRVVRAYLDLAPYDLRTAETVTLEATELVADSDYTLLPPGGYETGGTYGAVQLSRTTLASGAFVTSFGFARLAITGDWGLFLGAEDADPDIKSAAIETVAAWMDRPAAQVAELISAEPRTMGLSTVSTWDIPSSAHRKLQAWAHNVPAVY